MNLPSPPVFRPDEFGDTEPRLLQLLTSGFRDVFNALTQTPTREVRNATFTSAASGVTTVNVKNPLSAKPSHVTVALRQADLADFSAAWSWWWVMSGESVAVKFVGLPASIKHVCSIEFS